MKMIWVYELRFNFDFTCFPGPQRSQITNVELAIFESSVYFIRTEVYR